MYAIIFIHIIEFLYLIMFICNMHMALQQLLVPHLGMVKLKTKLAAYLRNYACAAVVQ